MLDHTRVAAAWSLRGDGAARLANLDNLRALLRELEPVARTLGEVVERLADLASADGEEDLSRADSDADVVRITSYFKAKGLEAPVVAIVHAHRATRPASHAIDRASGRIALKAGVLVPPGWDAYAKADRDADDAERVRWMYVAATRARDQLVIVRTARDTLLETYDRGLADGPHDALVTIAPGVSVRLLDATRLPEALSRTETFPGLDPLVDAALATPPVVGPDPAEAHRTAVREAVRSAARSSRRWRSVHELAMRSRVKGSADGLGPQGGGPSSTR